MVWYGMVWYGMVWYGMVWYGMVWYGMVWYGMVWYGMVWYGMVWYGMLLLLLLLLRHPARAGGRNCQARSPWAGRKGAVGRRYAGRAGADDDRGGGGVRRVGGGGCVRAWRRVGPPVDVTLEPSPAAGGRVTRPVRSGGGGGGWMEGPPVRGHAGHRLPLLPAAAPPRQGRGLLPVRRWCKGVEGAGYMYGLFPALGRSGCGRAAAQGCAGAQHVTTLGRSVGLRRGAVRGAQHAAALGRGVGL